MSAQPCSFDSMLQETVSISNIMSEHVGHASALALRSSRVAILCSNACMYAPGSTLALKSCGATIFVTMHICTMKRTCAEEYMSRTLRAAEMLHSSPNKKELAYCCVCA